MSDIVERVEQLETTIAEISKVIEAFKIDKQLVVRKNGNIEPGYGCKIIYNSDGIVVGKQDLTENDIPDINMSKIKNLNESLSKYATVKSVNDLSETVDRLTAKSETVKTGTKVNVDENGKVNNVSDLLVEDIPELPIDKIESLSDILNEIKLSLSEKAEPADDKIPSGISCKVEYDNTGHVIKSHKLTVDDLPKSVQLMMDKFNRVADMLVTTQDIQELKEKIDLKADKVYSSPGTYKSVTVNGNGQFISGNAELTIDDIPSIPIDKVEGLTNALLTKADHSSLIEVTNNISNLSVPSNNTEVDLSSIHESINELNSRIDKLISDDSISTEINDIKSAISQLSSRIVILEKNQN